ncbi:MAG: hypothetical protein H6509_05125 [Bryobacterales bacterium]|nr:hypothetical protein [Acidobacteriota bacterium]MCB9383973.1 hypothetical protein [Bryobacterales bacterium]
MSKSVKQAGLPVRQEPAEEPKSVYEPRTYSTQEQVMFAAKIVVVVGALVLLLWLLDQRA